MTTSSIDTLFEKPIIESRSGPLVEILPEFKPNTNYTASDFNNARLAEHAINGCVSNYEIACNPANIAVYTIENDIGVLYVGQRAAFNRVIGKNLKKVVEEMISNGHYNVKPKDLNYIRSESKNNPSEVQRFEVSKLYPVKRPKSEHAGEDNLDYFVINPADPEFDLTQKKYIKCLFKDKIDETMRMMADNKVKELRFYFFNTEYIRKNTKEGNGIAFTYRIDSLGQSISDISANENRVDKNFYKMFGEPIRPTKPVDARNVVYEAIKLLEGVPIERFKNVLRYLAKQKKVKPKPKIKPNGRK